MDREMPDAEALFEAARAHARLAHAGGYLLYDQVSGLYVAVDRDVGHMAAVVQAQAVRMWQKGRPPDVMADTGEIVNDFIPLYPPGKE